MKTKVLAFNDYVPSPGGQYAAASGVAIAQPRCPCGTGIDHAGRPVH